MKELKLIARNFAPHFFAISLLLAFIASRCGLASFCAYSYVIAPECSHILIVLISSVCFIISSFISAFSYALDFKGIACIFQGKTLFFVVFLRVLRGISAFFEIFCYQAFFHSFVKNQKSFFLALSFAENGIENAFENRLQSE